MHHDLSMFLHLYLKMAKQQRNIKYVSTLNVYSILNIINILFQIIFKSYKNILAGDINTLFRCKYLLISLNEKNYFKSLIVLLSENMVKSSLYLKLKHFRKIYTNYLHVILKLYASNKTLTDSDKSMGTLLMNEQPILEMLNKSKIQNVVFHSKICFYR